MYKRQGQIIEKREVSDITLEKFKNVLKNFIGEIEQVPPMYSALKVDGKKLYELDVYKRQANNITTYF